MKIKVEQKRLEQFFHKKQQNERVVLIETEEFVYQTKPDEAWRAPELRIISICYS
jgi:hypothetical protein